MTMKVNYKYRLGGELVTQKVWNEYQMKKPRTKKYECPDCTGKFSFHHDPGDCPPPQFCPLCGSNVSSDELYQPPLLHIAKSIGKVADDTYRQMEQASDARIEMAAEMTGYDRSELSGMKITDMRDNMREGDVAANLPSNPVSQALEAQQGHQNSMVGFQKAAPGIQMPHIEPKAGARAMKSTTEFHKKNSASIIAAGKTNR